MRLMTIFVTLAILMTLAASLPAQAQTGCERAHECGENLGWVNPTGDISSSPYIWDPVYGYEHESTTYGLLSICQHNEGYYYLGNDGVWYWFYC